MRIAPLKALWLYNGVAFAVLITMLSISASRRQHGLAPVASIDAPAPVRPATFGITADEFQVAFINSAARVENGQHNDGIAKCDSVGDGIVDCLMKDKGFVEASKAMAELGAPYPDRKKTLNEHIVLFTADGQLARVEVRGNRDVGHALHMVGTVADAATALGAKLGDQQTMVNFMRAIGLVETPPPLGEQISVHRTWAEVTCALMSADSAAYTCAFTPPNHTIRLAPTMARPSPPADVADIADVDDAATLSDLAEGTGSAWRRADNDTRAFYASAGIALIDAQRDIGMSDGGQRAAAAWLKLCMDREAPSRPNTKLVTIMNECMHSMSPRDAAAIAMAESAGE